MCTRRTIVQWTETAGKQLEGLHKDTRVGIMRELDEIVEASCNNTQTHQALTGPLKDYCVFSYARYRVIYCVDEDELCTGDVLVRIYIMSIAMGKREERSKEEISRVVERLLEYSFIMK